MKSFAMMAAVVVLAASAADAATYTTTFQEVGANVVATGSGAFDLTGLVLSFPNIPQENRVLSSTDFFLFGSGNSSGYDLVMSGPPSFGSGGEVQADSWSGDQVGIWVDQNRIYVPVGYASNAALSNSATWLGDSFASLGLSIGTFSYTFGNNTYNVVIGGSVSPVPVPAGLPLLAAALGALAFVRRRRGA